MTAAAPPREVVEHLIGTVDGERAPVGTVRLRLVLPLRTVDHPDPVDLTAWAITHPLGNLAGGTHTEVALLGNAADLPERAADDLVRQVAGIVYGPGRWAFHYRPDEVPGRVLRYGSRLRERVEVVEVELWQ